MATTTNGPSKGEKFASAAGNFVGAATGGFVPPINVTVNNNKAAGGKGIPAPRGGVESLLPAPEFSSPAQIREYCNTLRAAAVSLSFEVAMGAEILKAVLSTVPDPEGRMGGSKIRAFKVSRKMQRAADELRNTAKLAAATYAAFAQEYEGELNAHRAKARPQQPRMTWGQQ
ncbi:sporulation protein SsgA [Streptomyces sp. McG5]|uniref:plasmid transfer protein TraA n=1 Tax=unclassified Streptomyces TaxID=2593676 RepID=UPI000D660888|nr:MULTISPECIES: plasmid transfer protein TraA [unclassified Streptomyces]AWL36644.1 sporulation protein SsgA [Streptomyces sp. SM17]AWL36656.1 sporulation protein SsgA [Streptomyces sp. SM17]MBT2877654.1 sporulation protein SsgA [Streptomyces sp. McG6]MBT2884990.1 sporulation protein SsgA [Streptomyces sp. McG5]MBT2890469.1 sporulation protein SsgA [Streptomyces sp. McG2]